VLAVVVVVVVVVLAVLYGKDERKGGRPS